MVDDGNNLFEELNQPTSVTSSSNKALETPTNTKSDTDKLLSNKPEKPITNTKSGTDTDLVSI